MRYKHYFDQTEMFVFNVQYGFPCPRGGGKLSRLVYLAPRPGFGSGSVISQFLLHHYLGIFSCKRYKHYFSQTEMFTSNIQFGYPCPRGGGQAVQAGLSCPPAQDLNQALSSVSSYCTITLEYLVVRVVNIIFSQTLGLVILVRGVRASCPGWFIEILGRGGGGEGGKINRPGQLIPHPLSIRNPTEHLK